MTIHKKFLGYTVVGRFKRISSRIIEVRTEFIHKLE